MFEWKVENMFLMNKDNSYTLGKKKFYNCENSTAREDKIAFVDNRTDGKLSYLLELVDRFNKDKDDLPKDSWGHVKTVSLKAWIKRNDNKYGKPIVDDWYHYGKINLLGCERYITNMKKGTYDTHEDFVDEVFHRALVKCEDEEKRYFKEHDEYEILKKKLRDKKYYTTFGVRISDWSSGKMCIIDDNDSSKEREITIEELKILLAKYEELEKFIEKLTLEVDIKY